MNHFQENVPFTAGRMASQHHIEALRQQGGIFVEAVRVTRTPVLVTDATLPGNPIVFANNAFSDLSGYDIDELAGQDPHFMNGDETDPDAIRRYETAMRDHRHETVEILQYRKDGTPFRAILFASPLDDGQGRVINHFVSYLDIARRHDGEEKVRLASELEGRVAARTRELEAANNRLTQLVAEKEVLLVEVNHRAKNSIAVAASLLSIQGRAQSDGAVKALFGEARDRLTAMAQVHDLLSKSESSQRVDVATYLTDLCEALRPVTENDDRIRLEANAEKGISIGANTAVPFGLVVTELVTNAAKYAFPGPRSGTILVQVQRREPGWIELLIRDDGIGMSDIREGSLGYGLIRSLVQQIRGEIDIQSEAGVAVTISFPDFVATGSIL
jgi:PAS domain S-box-containing protein